MSKRILFGASVAIFFVMAFAEDKTPASSAPAQLIVTVEARHGGNVPVLNREDFLVSQSKEKFEVTDAERLVGDRAGLELFVLIDDASNWTLTSQLNDLRHFVNTQPVTTAVGIGYMHNGSVFTAESLTKDHSLAAKAIRIPTGTSSSPYLSVASLIKQWPGSGARREIVIISSGADPLGGSGIMNPYLDAAITDAQRAGVIVYAIYTPGIGHSAHSYWRANWGQNYLGELADDTGGEAYMLGLGSPVSMAPYLADITARLASQYRITLLAKAANKPELQSIRLTTEIPNAEIVAPSKVYVPAAR
jgi:hypothetical protein